MDGDARRAGHERWILLAGVWLVYFCFGLTTVSMAPLVRPIGDELGIGPAAMGGVLGAWPLVYIASAVPCGAILDRFGLRRALFLAALIIAASGALRALAGNHVSLFLAVAVFGLGGPLVSIGGPKLVAQWFEEGKRGLAMGIYITGPALGGVAALALTNSVMMPLFDGDWRRVLLAYAGAAFLAGLAWLAIARNATVESEPAAAGLGGQARIFLELLAVPRVRRILVMSVGIFFFNHGLNNWLPEILASRGMDAASAGFWAAIPTGVGVVAALTIPRFAVASRRLWLLLGVLTIAGIATLLLQAAPGPLLASGLVLQGIARGSMNVLAMLILMETSEVGAKRIGSAGGMFVSSDEIGGVIGPLTVGALLGLTGGFSAALGLMTVIMAALFALAVGLRRTSPAI